MSETLQIPDDVLLVQREASDPFASAWVAANAGSGKTHVLARRVIRLLLSGVEPAKILCLTFTKAAAANMANQVFTTLAHWVALDDDNLDRAIADIEGKRPPASIRARARRLFAQALETPGGLKVQTIHAFCSWSLHEIPFAADVAARFSVLEEFAQRDLLERLRLEVLLEAAATPKSPLGRALEAAITAGADKAFGAAVGDLIEKRDALIAWIERAGGIEAAIADLSVTLGVAPGDSSAGIELAMMQSPNLAVAQWTAVADLLTAGSKSDRDRAAQLHAAASLSQTARLEAYLSVFFTAGGAPRNRVVTTTFAKSHPELAERLEAEKMRLEQLAIKHRAVLARERTAAALRIAQAIIDRYRREKENRGLLDYDDLVEKSLALLVNVEAAWVHYKLDLGIDHVLIDEAQDTSSRQWEIIRRLTAEFTAGEGVRKPQTRSIFAVGDEKQSIFSFQGAAPEQFADMARLFAVGHRGAELAFRHCKFQFSFRSGENVLGSVDRVFARPEIFRSVTSDMDGVPPHVALPGKAPGLVEMWPPVEGAPTKEIDAWDAPFDEPSQSNPQVKLAERIATTIAILLEQSRSAGDVLVLVRQRGPLFEAIIRALKNAGIPVAGADRLVLIEHIAVMDLLVLADALLHEDDDLALATVLKSPLFGFDEEALFALAWNRRGTLRAALREAADPTCAAAAAAKLERLAELARREVPFGFYAHLLGGEGGRRQILARLGAEAADALDEFLNLALAYETTEAPSLQGFVAFMRAAATEVKRDMDIVRDEVRVMTVHGAKGLEAPVVILADTTTRPAGPRDPRILTIARPDAASGAPHCLVWAGPKDQDVKIMAAARERARGQAEDEYRRLLYVAMTRAAEHLIICGAHGSNGKPTGCWYDLVHQALASDATEEPAIDSNGTVLRWRKVPGDLPAHRSLRSEPEPIEIPAWLSRTLEPPARVLTLPPSRAREPSDTSRPGETDAERKALMRGRLAHRLMQSLPEIAVAERAEAARRYIDRAAPDWDEVERDRLLAEILAVLGEPRFAAVFAPETRAEVPIRGRIARTSGAPLLISGQVDRLAVTDASILIADYKTDRPAPRQPQEAPKSYVEQLALYRAVLEKVYPGREVRAALLWTDSLELVELPACALDAALADLRMR